MANKNSYLEFLAEWLSPLGQISSRSMFGGHCLYCDGVVFALVADNVLYLKADNVSRPSFEGLGLKPFRPYADRPDTMQYYPPPPEFFEDAEVMERWGRTAIEASRRARPEKRSAARRGKR